MFFLYEGAETPSLHEKSPLTHLSYGDHNSPGTECNGKAD